MKALARIVLLLAAFLALLPIMHHHDSGHDSGCDQHSDHDSGQDSGQDSQHGERFCVLTTLQKAASVEAVPATVVRPERLDERTIAECATPLPPAIHRGNLSSRAPPAV